MRSRSVAEAPRASVPGGRAGAARAGGRRLAGTALTALLLASACGGGSSGGSAVRTGTFVGRLSGTETCVAVVAGTQAVVAFVADVDAGLNVPFSGPRSDGTTVLEGANGARLALRVARKRIRGRVTLARGHRSFAADAAVGDAGLYRAAGRLGDEPAWVGWVVLNDGTQCGVAGTTEGVIAPSALDPATQTFTVGDAVVEAVKVEPDAAATDVEDPGTTFAGGTGFSGGLDSFGGFSTFGFGQFSGSFNTGFGGGFGFAGKGSFGFGGGGFNPGLFARDRGRR